MRKTNSEIIEETIAKIGKKGETVWLFDYTNRIFKEVATDDQKLTPELVNESFKSYQQYVLNGGRVRLVPLMREKVNVPWLNDFPALVRMLKVQNGTRVKTMLHLN